MNKGLGAFFGFTWSGLALVASSCGTAPRHPTELVTGRFSTHQGMGNVHCVFDATVE